MLVRPFSLALLALAACSAAPSTPTPDAGTPDGEASDGGASDGGASDGGAGDGEWREVFAHVVPDDRLVDMRLEFAPGDWQKLLEEWRSSRLKTEFPAAFRFDAETLPRIGVRLKGLNSLWIPETGEIPLTGRYPLKLDFNSQGGERFHGVDELSLNTAGNDPSRMRDWLTSRMYQAVGIEAAHTGFAEVRIDGQLIGPYVLSQVIDKRFLKERFGTGDLDDGNLYKCVYNGFGACALEWKGPEKSAYYRRADGAGACADGFDDCGLVLQTNEDDPSLNDYSDLIHFLDVLNNTPDASFETEIVKVFDVDHLLRVAAVAYATSNFDSYFGKGHNYYLYRRADGRFQMIPWDFDLAYGAATCEADIGDPTCGQRASHPLVDRIFAVPKWRTAYLQYLRVVADTMLTRERHAAWIDQARAFLDAAIARDPNPLGASEGGSYASQLDPAGGGPNNIFAFVEAKRAHILGRLEQ